MFRLGPYIYIKNFQKIIILQISVFYCSKLEFLKLTIMMIDHVCVLVLRLWDLCFVLFLSIHYYANHMILLMLNVFKETA